MAQTIHYIDYNQLYSFTLDYDSAHQRLKVTLGDENAPWPRLAKAFIHQAHVESSGRDCRPLRRGQTVTFDHVTRDFTLRLGKEPIGRYAIGLNGTLSRTFERPLTVDETRRMGTFYHCEPYAQPGDPLSMALLNNAKNAVTTDFHTHSSGQITARGLLDVAMKHKPYYYPVELLTDADVDTSFVNIPQKSRKLIPRVRFTPIERPGITYSDEVEAADLHMLSPADLRKLETHMTLPPDRQSTFTEMELSGYRFRYPFTKDVRLLHDTIKKVAQEYAAQGIDYACISFVGLDDPKKLAIVHKTMEEIHHDPATKDVDLRFMVGVPRGLPLPEIQERLEKAKILLDSPYIIGVDFLGYEVNKTKEFVDLFEEFAKWANEYKPGACLRVHAGENDKNRDNVKEFLQMALRYPNLHFLVGHGLYGIDEETTKLAKRLCKDPKNPRLTLEFNPSSNIALNNIDDLKKVPFQFAVENNIPFVVSSDSAGMYQTGAVQLGLAAYYGGLDEMGFAALKEHQRYLQMHQLQYSQTIAEGIPGWDTEEGNTHLIEQLGERLRAVPAAILPPKPNVDEVAIEAKLKADHVKLIRPNESVPEFRGKRPVVIIGASGESWKRIPRCQQRENAIAADILIHAMSDDCYLVDGRYKKTGLSKVNNQSLRDANETREAKHKPTIYNLGIRVDPSFGDSDNKQSYKHLTHMLWVPGQPLDIADAIVDYTFAHDGVLVAIDGSAFTRDIILKADQGKKGQSGIRDRDPDNRKMMMLLGNTPGASGEKAAVLHPDYVARDGRQLIKKLYEQQPDLFAKSFSPSKLNKLYEESSARVATYGYNMMDSSLVSNVQRISSHPVKSPAEKKPNRGG